MFYRFMKGLKHFLILPIFYLENQPGRSEVFTGKVQNPEIYTGQVKITKHYHRAGNKKNRNYYRTGKKKQKYDWACPPGKFHLELIQDV